MTRTEAGLRSISGGLHQSLTVFVDRDGVINQRREGDYVRTWTDFEFFPRAKEALALLTKAGHRTIVVTNQRGIARGLMTESDLAEIHHNMIAEAAAAGALVAAVYYCPHDIGKCSCRKPETGLFLQARRDFPDIDFSAAAVIGDSPSDVAAGVRLGCRTILVGDDESRECAASLCRCGRQILDVSRRPVDPGLRHGRSGLPGNECACSSSLTACLTRRIAAIACVCTACSGKSPGTPRSTSRRSCTIRTRLHTRQICAGSPAK